MRPSVRFCSLVVCLFLLLPAQHGMAEYKIGLSGEVVANLNEPGVTPLLLVESILGGDVRVVGVHFTGAKRQAGFISGLDLLDLSSEQVVISTGGVDKIVGPNDSDKTSAVEFDLNIEDSDFYRLNDDHFTRDESILNVEFIPADEQDQVVIEYVFGSDEYSADTASLPGKQHDFMAILVNGVNCATVPDGDIAVEKVGVASINNELNADLYVENIRTSSGLFSKATSPYSTEMDGFSKVLTCVAPVNAGEVNQLKIGIVDAYQGLRKGGVDSWALIKIVDAARLLDNDGDGVPNYIDLDDDNDGISDTVEGGYDVDGDGLPNSFDTDSDGDGESDRSECSNELSCSDRDNDGIADFVDTSDLVGEVGDSDGDGIADGIECQTPGQYGELCADTDSDLIPDYSDEDSNNNGLSDKDECAVDDGSTCVDVDKDEIPDYLDLDVSVIQVPTPGGESQSDQGDETSPRGVDDIDTNTDGNEDPFVKVGVDGVGAFDLALLGIFLVLAVGRYASRKKTAVSSRSFLAATGGLVMGFTLIGQSSDLYAGSLFESKIFDGSYVGLGFGPSTLKPDASSSYYSLDDSIDTGYKLSAGVDLFDQLSIEAALADLGEAELSSSGFIAYKPFSLSGVYHLFGQRSRSVFLKAGLSTLNTSANIPTHEENDMQLLLGLGGEWAFKKGWSLRAELESYDKDASQMTVGLVKRFSYKEKYVAQEEEIDKIFTDAVKIVEFNDKHTEICADISESECTIPPIVEQQKSCAIVAGRIEGIYFDVNSAELIPSARTVLDEASDALKTCPSYSVDIKAYADNIGAAERNLVLSRHRAQAVRLHLVARGVAISRLSANGYGEKNPIADNATKEGRALNRRVEFHLKKVETLGFVLSDG